MFIDGGGWICVGCSGGGVGGCWLWHVVAKGGIMDFKEWFSSCDAPLDGPENIKRRNSSLEESGPGFAHMSDVSLGFSSTYGCESKPKVPFWGWLPPHYSLF